MFERMRGWRGGLPETVCGNGSLEHNTRNIRGWLPEMVGRWNIRSVCDAGAGDMHWMSNMFWAVDYRPFDLIQRKPEITQIDITKEKLPDCDAILCRMVLNHLGDDPSRILAALSLFRQAAPWLIATQFTPEDKPLPQRSTQFQRLDLRGEPYNLGRPVESVQDGAESWCSLALWNLRR